MSGTLDDLLEMAKEIRGIADLSLKKKKAPQQQQQNDDDGFVLPLPQRESPAGAPSTPTVYANDKFIGMIKELVDEVLK